MTRTSFTRSVVVSALVILGTVGAAGAQPSFPPTSFLTPAKATWESTRSLVIGIVEVMPEDKYDVKPPLLSTAAALSPDRVPPSVRFSPPRRYSDEHLNTWVADPPFVWFPAVLVLAAWAGHIRVVRKLLLQRPA